MVSLRANSLNPHSLWSNVLQLHWPSRLCNVCMDPHRGDDGPEHLADEPSATSMLLWVAHILRYILHVSLLLLLDHEWEQQKDRSIQEEVPEGATKR